MAGEHVTMKNIILAICLALSFSFTTVYSARQDNGGGNNSGEWHRIPLWEYDNDNGDYGMWDDYIPAQKPGCHPYRNRYSYDSPDKLQEKQDIQDPISPEESNRLDIGTTVKDEAPSPQSQPQSISTAAAAYTTAEGIYYTDDIASGVYEFIPYKEPQPTADNHWPIDANDTGWLCEPPLPPVDEDPILEDGGKAPDPCIGEPPISDEPTVGEPPLPIEPTVGEPPLPPMLIEPPLPPTVGEPPLAPDPELDVPVPDPVETE